MKERPEGLFGQNVTTQTIRLKTLSFCLQTLSLRCGQWERHSSFLPSFLPSFLFLSLPPSLISRPWVLEDPETNALTWVSKHGSWEVSHESDDGPRNTSANDILLHFSEESPTDHFKLGQAVPGKAFWIGKKKWKFQICWLKVTLLRWEFLVIWIQSDLVSCERKRTWVSIYNILGIEARFEDE